MERLVGCKCSVAWNNLVKWIFVESFVDSRSDTVFEPFVDDIVETVDSSFVGRQYNSEPFAKIVRFVAS